MKSRIIILTVILLLVPVLIPIPSSFQSSYFLLFENKSNVPELRLDTVGGWL
jgi:hypothetical protein